MPTGSRSILTIGSFDGVHLGHQALLHAATQLARAHDHRERLAPASTHVIALAFDPHPSTVLRPGSEPPRLTSWEARADLLRRAGADTVIRLEPTPDLLALAPEQFADRLVAQHRPVAIVEGPDFRFGKARAGDVALLRRLGRDRPEHEQFAVHAVEPVTVALADHSIVTASSTMTRWLLTHARVADAARVLGRPYAITGTVVRGDRRGRTIGYPTANVAPESMLPADGVYAALAHASTPGGAPVATFPAAVSVGTKPQFTPDQTARTLEAHLLDAPRAPGADAILGLPEYAWRLTLELRAFLRHQARFDSLEALIAQIDRDCARARELLAIAPTLPEPLLHIPSADPEHATTP